VCIYTRMWFICFTLLPIFLHRCICVSIHISTLLSPLVIYQSVCQFLKYIC
jgi:hypothetical protein